MAILPVAPVERLIRKAGAKRVSSDAAKTLSSILEDIALDVSSKSIQLSRHAGRKTINADDVKLAAQ